MTPIDTTPIDTPQQSSPSALARSDLRRSVSVRIPFRAMDRKSVSASALAWRWPNISAHPGAAEPQRNDDRYGYLAMGCADDVLDGDVLDDEIVPTAANNNGDESSLLLDRGDDAAVAIGLALRYVRMNRDVPFGIVCILNRHVRAGDGAAEATLDLLKRRAERRHEARLSELVALRRRARRPRPRLVGVSDREAGR